MNGSAATLHQDSALPAWLSLIRAPEAQAGSLANAPPLRLTETLTPNTESAAIFGDADCNQNSKEIAVPHRRAPARAGQNSILPRTFGTRTVISPTRCRCFGLEPVGVPPAVVGAFVSCACKPVTVQLAFLHLEEYERFADVAGQEHPGRPFSRAKQICRKHVTPTCEMPTIYYSARLNYTFEPFLDITDLAVCLPFRYQAHRFFVRLRCYELFSC